MGPSDDPIGESGWSFGHVIDSVYRDRESPSQGRKLGWVPCRSPALAQGTWTALLDPGPKEDCRMGLQWVEPSKACGSGQRSIGFCLKVVLQPSDLQEKCVAAMQWGKSLFFSKNSARANAYISANKWNLISSFFFIHKITILSELQTKIWKIKQ